MSPTNANTLIIWTYLNGFRSDCVLRRTYNKVNVRIRGLQKNELPLLTEMLYEAIFVPEGNDPLPKEIIKDKALAKYIENWEKDEFDIALVAEKNNLLVGLIWGRIFHSKNKGFGYVDSNTPELSIAVKNQFRNQGIGTELLKAIFLKYQKIGINAVSLSVDKLNNASNLYKRIGFTIVEETGTSWTMIRKL